MSLDSNLCAQCQKAKIVVMPFCSLECGLAARTRFQSRIDKIVDRIAYLNSELDAEKEVLNHINDSIRNFDGGFYKTKAWREVRYAAIEKYGRKCAACNRTGEDGVVMHVDHIIPRSKDRTRELDITNLQVLCEDCNLGKGNRYSTDWRRK